MFGYNIQKITVFHVFMCVAYFIEVDILATVWFPSIYLLDNISSALEYLKYTKINEHENILVYNLLHKGQFYTLHNSTWTGHTKHVSVCTAMQESLSLLRLRMHDPTS